MSTKKCFKCGAEKLIDEFYKHPAMADGHLGKCKECTKNDIHEKYLQNIKNPEYVEKERRRGREKYKRLGYVSLKAVHTEGRDTARKLRLIIPEGHECHHWNYNLRNDVFIIDRRSHKFIHKYIKFDKASNMFINSYTGELLDSREKHYDFMLDTFKRVKYSFSISVQQNHTKRA